MENTLTAPFRPAATRHDENEPREPPPPATLLQFPSCSPQGPSIADHFGRKWVKGYNRANRTFLDDKFFDSFNVRITQDVPLDNLFSTESLPSKSWTEDPAITQGSDFTLTPPLTEILSNGREAPSHKEFYNLSKELSYENGESFTAARRLPAPPGRPLPRISHSLRFWIGLADMSEYWDTSLDNYIDAAEETEEKVLDIDELMNAEENPSVEEKPKQTYTGRRIDTGSKMPPKFREETVFRFVEMIARLFNCTLAEPTMQPRLYIQKYQFNTSHLISVYRVPKDPRKARTGMKEGPMMGISCRDQTKFREGYQSVGNGRAETIDLLKETSILTMIAQKRALEGKPQVEPWEGKWWATKPRWGGGPGGEFGTSDEKPLKGEAVVPAENASPKKRTKKTSQAEEWAAMKPPQSLWEKGVTYQQIGKEKGSEYDDVSDIGSFGMICHSLLNELVFS